MTIDVGLKYDPQQGLTFFGVDEVNTAIANGHTVTSVNPDKATFIKKGEDDEFVTLIPTGFVIQINLQ